MPACGYIKMRAVRYYSGIFIVNNPVLDSRLDTSVSRLHLLPYSSTKSSVLSLDLLEDFSEELFFDFLGDFPGESINLNCSFTCGESIKRLITIIFLYLHLYSFLKNYDQMMINILYYQIDKYFLVYYFQ